jgi:hypothetical protein
VQEDEHVEGRYNIKTSLATHAELATVISMREKKRNKREVENARRAL